MPCGSSARSPRHGDPLEVAQAESHYRQALALAEALGMRPLQAHCHRGLGTLYAATGQREQARTELSTAIEMYRAMDMTFWLPQTEASPGAGGGTVMDYDAVLAQVITLLQQEQRVAYRVLKRRLQLDDEILEDLKDDLIYAKKLAVDEDGRVLVWTGSTAPTATPPPVPSTSAPPAHSAPDHAREPLSYTPKHLAEKILTSRSALEGERKQVTVLFCDLGELHPDCREHRTGSNAYLVAIGSSN